MYLYVWNCFAGIFKNDFLKKRTGLVFLGFYQSRRDIRSVKTRTPLCITSRRDMRSVEKWPHGFVASRTGRQMIGNKSGYRSCVPTARDCYLKFILCFGLQEK